EVLRPGARGPPGARARVGQLGTALRRDLAGRSIEGGLDMRLLRLLYTVPLRLRSLFRRDRVEQDLEDEFRDHLERRIEADMASGLTREEAGRRALQAFGGVDQRKEECRDVRRLTLVDHGIQDLRFAFRQLLKHRGFAATAIVVLALGIAGSVAIFGFVDATLI